MPCPPRRSPPRTGRSRSPTATSAVGRRPDCWQSGLRPPGGTVRRAPLYRRRGRRLRRGPRSRAPGHRPSGRQRDLRRLPGPRAPGQPDPGPRRRQDRNPGHPQASSRAYHAEDHRRARRTRQDTWDDIKTDPSVRCVIITGAGERHFSTGADVSLASGALRDAVARARLGQRDLTNRLQSAQAQHARRASLQARRRLTEQWA